MTSTLPAARPAAGTITVRNLPRSTPPSIRWPSDREPRSDVGPLPAAVQPPLPWHDGRSAPMPGGREHRDLHGVRTISFGESWAEPGRPDLPDPVRWSRRLAAVLLEALHRRRPLSQLTRWLDEPTLTLLSAQVRRRPWRGQSHLAAVHLHRVNPATVETSVALRTADGRGTALAFRLEAVGGRWLCTALVIPPTVRPH